MDGVYKLDVITSKFSFILFKIFSLNKVNWLPQCYSQYNPRGHFSPRLCYSLLCGFYILVILSTVEEMSALASCGNKEFLCLVDQCLEHSHSCDACPLASLTACQGTGWHEGWTQRPRHGSGLYYWVTAPALLLHFYSETGLLSCPSWPWIHSGPERLRSPWGPLLVCDPHITHLKWPSAVGTAPFCLWVCCCSESWKESQTGCHHSEQEPVLVSCRTWGNTVANISLKPISDAAVSKCCSRRYKPAYLLLTVAILTSEVLQWTSS